MVIVINFTDVKTNLSFLDEVKFIISNYPIDAFVWRINSADKFVWYLNVSFGGKILQQKKALLDNIDLIGESGLFAKTWTDFSEKGLFFVDFILLISPAVINEKLFNFLSSFEGEFEAGLEPFENREIIFQVFFFSPQLTKNIANLSIQVDNHNNAKYLH